MANIFRTAQRQLAMALALVGYALFGAAHAADTTSTNSDPNMSYPITITVAGKTLEATLEDNAASRELLERMPFTVPMERLYAREMCHHLGRNALTVERTRADNYEVGDLIYWPPMGSLVILFKQNGERFSRQHLGHISNDVSFFASGADAVDVTFARKE